MRGITNYRPISLLSHMYKLFTRILPQRMEKVLDENQPREQAGFRKKGYSTVDYLQTINQLTEKCNEFKRPLCIGHIDYEKAFDSIEHESIFRAQRSIGINETYITILEDTYTGATPRVHIDSRLRRNTNTKSREAGRPNFPQIIHSNNSGGVSKCPARRERNEYRWRKTVKPNICW